MLKYTSYLKKSVLIWGDLDLDQIVESVQRGLPSSLTIEELYTFIAEVIASRVIYHPDYAILAGRIETRKLYLKVPYSFSENVERLRKYRPRKSNSYSQYHLLL